MTTYKIRNKTNSYRKLIGLFFTIAALISCSENENTAEDLYGKRPEIPPITNIDINADTKTDFFIEYEELMTTDIPSSGGSIIGYIRPSNGFELLYHSPDGYLFFQKDDTITVENKTETFWNSYPASIVSIHRHHNNWDKYWKVISTSKTGYYLIFKKTVEDDSQIGWLKLQIDTLNGQISLIDKMISEYEKLVIE